MKVVLSLVVLGMVVLWGQTTSAPAVESKWWPGWKGAGHSDVKTNEMKTTNTRWGPTYKGKSVKSQNKVDEEDVKPVRWGPTYKGKSVKSQNKVDEEDVKPVRWGPTYKGKAVKSQNKVDEEDAKPVRWGPTYKGKVTVQQHGDKANAKSQTDKDAFDKMYGKKDVKSMEERKTEDDDLFDKVWGKEADDSNSKSRTTSQSMEDEFEKTYHDTEGGNDSEEFEKHFGKTDDKAQTSEIHQLEHDLEDALNKVHSLTGGK